MKRLVLLASLTVFAVSGLGQFRGSFRGGFARGGFGHGGILRGGFASHGFVGGRIGFGHGFGYLGPRSGFRGFVGSRGFHLRFGRVPAFHYFGRSPWFGYGVFAPWVYPVFVGGFDYPAYPYPPQPNIIVIYPAAPEPPPEPLRSQIVEYRFGPKEMEAPDPSAVHNDRPYALIPLKDSSVHAAIAWWIEGDTLHFIDTRGRHDEVALAQVDRELSRKLNEGRQISFKLPAE